MPPALVYIRGTAMDFPIPPADNRINYSPKVSPDPAIFSEPGWLPRRR